MARSAQAGADRARLMVERRYGCARALFKAETELGWLGVGTGRFF